MDNCQVTGYMEQPLFDWMKSREDPISLRFLIIIYPAVLYDHYYSVSIYAKILFSEMLNNK